jgi:hypothetical protein
MPADYLSPKSATKKAIDAFLFERGVRTLLVWDKEGTILKRFGHATWKKNAPQGPSKEEMRAYLRRWYGDRPQTHLTRVQELLWLEVCAALLVHLHACADRDVSCVSVVRA